MKTNLNEYLNVKAYNDYAAGCMAALSDMDDMKDDILSGVMGGAAAALKMVHQKDKSFAYTVGYCMTVEGAMMIITQED